MQKIKSPAVDAPSASGPVEGLDMNNQFMAMRAVGEMGRELPQAPENPFQGPQSDSPTFFDAMLRSALLINTEANLAKMAGNALSEMPEADPNFDPFEFAKKNAKDPRVSRALPYLVEEDGDRLMKATSEGAFWKIVDGLNSELDDTAVAGSHGILPALAGGAFGIVASPSTYMVGGALEKLSRAPSIVRMLRGSTALRGAMIGAGEQAISSAVQAQAQDTYTLQQAFLDLGVGAGLGGLAGRLLLSDVPGSPLYPARTPAEVTKHPLSAHTAAETIDVPAGLDATDVLREARKSLSAASLSPTQAGAGSSLPVFDALTPVGRAIKRSKMNDVDFGLHQRLYEMSVRTTDNEAEVATAPSAELMSRLLHARLFTVREAELETMYRQMALDVFGENRVVATAKNMANLKAERLTPDQFFELITDYRRAKSVLETEGASANAAAKALVDKPHPDDRVSAYVKQAAQIEDRYYNAYADELVKHGMLDEADRRATYAPSMVNRKSVVLFEDEFRELLRDRFRTAPPADWLEARYGKQSIKDLAAPEREEAIAQWVSDQKEGFERAAQKSLDTAHANLKQTLADLKTVRKAETKVERATLRAELRAARDAEAELQTNWQRLTAEAEQARAEHAAMQRALDEAIARERARAETQVPERPDVGERQLAKLDAAMSADKRAEGSALRTIADALKDPAAAGRVENAGDVVKATQRLERTGQAVTDAERAATVDPLVAPKGPQAERTISTEVARERMKAANRKLDDVDRELARTQQKLERIQSDRAAAEARLAKLKEVRADAAKNARILEKAKKRARADVTKAEGRVRAAEEGKFKTAEERIDEIVKNVLMGKDIPRAVMREVTPGSGRLKEREVFEGNILMDPRAKKFLRNDANHIADMYGRDIAPRLALRKAFGNETDDNLTSQLEQLRSSWQEKVNSASADKERMAKRMDESVEDFKAMRDKLLGKLGMPDNPDSALMWLNRNVRRYNVTRLMGLALLSSLTDIATGVLATKKAMAWVPAFGKRAAKIAAQMPDRELRALLIGSEQARASSALTRRIMPEDQNFFNTGGIGTGATYKITSSVDRGLDFLARTTNTMSGLGGWTAKLKFTFGTIQIDNMIRELGKWSSLSNKQRTNWARLGIDEGWAKRIGAQLEKHSEDIEGVRLPNGKAWTDAEAYTRFQLALSRTMDEAVIAPGIGDTPVFMSKPAGQLLLQFSSYAFAGTNRYTRLAWQQRDVNALVSLHMMMAFATLGYVAREFVKGTNNKGETPMQRLEKNKSADWIYEAFTRSALPGAFSTGIDAMRKLAAGPVQDA